VMVSLADLSVWCHECSAYLIHDNLRPTLRKLELLKFPPSDGNTADEKIVEENVE
jgi:ribosomal protein L33